MEVDKDSDEELSLTEFHDMINRNRVRKATQRGEKAFAELDTNKVAGNNSIN